jgi:fructose-specific phosphotransferase system IIC component
MPGMFPGTSPMQGGARMGDKARFIFPILIAAIVVFVVSAVVTWANIGFRRRFRETLLSAFLLGWPVAAITAFIVIPPVRRLTAQLTAFLDRKF